MPVIYTPDPTNTAQPADTDYAYLQAAELRTLKAYLAAQLGGLGGPVNASVFRNKNAILNGSFLLKQRGATDANGYLMDRWAVKSTGSSSVQTQQAFTVGQIDVPYEPAYYSQDVVTSVANAANYVYKTQRIEGVRSFAGQTITLSFWAKADAAKNIATEFMQQFGTGGSPSADVTAIGVTTHALTTTWTKYQVSVAIPAITGKAIGTNLNDYLALNFWFDAGSSVSARTNSLIQQNGTFSIAQVQVELGGYATPLEYRTIGEEIRLCQRYYEKSYEVGTAPGTVTIAGSVQARRVQSAEPVTLLGSVFKTTKRATPTVTWYSTSAATAARIFNISTSTLITVTGTHGIDPICTTRTGSPSHAGDGTAGDYIRAHWTADAEL